MIQKKITFDSFIDSDGHYRHSISGQPTQRSAASFLHSMADSLSYLSDGHFLSEQIASEEPGNLHIGCFAGAPRQ